MEIIKAEDLNFTYALGKTPALKNVSFSVSRGDLVAVCGATGSGKSTLLRLLKKEIAPVGDQRGRIFFGYIKDGKEGGFGFKNVEDMSTRESAEKIGFVMQDPEHQIVTDKVWHELAFGLENLGVKNDAIRRRVSEMASYFGIESWFEKNVNELSGGQKQLLNLASVMVMQPEVLLLDEPTAQLDPIAAADFIATVAKLNRETALTVIITEHRLENVIPVATKLMALEDGRLTAYGEVRKTVAALAKDPKMLVGMPAAVRLFSRLSAKGECPLDVCEGRRFIEDNCVNEIRALPVKTENRNHETALCFKNVGFRYDNRGADVIRNMSFEVREGEIFCLLGGNGSGKSTTLGLASGVLKENSGKIEIFGKKIKDHKGGALYKECVAMLPQDVRTLFIYDTVKEELKEVEFSPEMLPFDLSPLEDRHPYDLSGGEQQLLGLAKVLSAKPKLLLMDEPTKGLDAYAKKEIAGVLRELKKRGLTILFVTHDVEFAAAVADRCALVFRGEVTSEGETHEFFAANNFYTTAVNRMTRGFYDGLLRVREVEEIIRLNGGHKE